MKAIKRDVYLNRLISRKENGLIKIITGIRRCGKSYLLNEIFVNHLKESGVKEDHIIKLALDREENKKYHDSKLLNEYIHSNIKDKNMHYVILDDVFYPGGPAPDLRAGCSGEPDARNGHRGDHCAAGKGNA